MLAVDVPIPFDWFFLALRFAFVAILYLFLWQVLRITMRDLRQASPPQTKRRATKAKIVVLDPAESGLAEGMVFSVGNKSTVGRHPECSIVIDEPFLSSFHAEFTYRNHAWYLTDRGSTNGTLINGRPLTGTAYVETDDMIQLGRMTVRFLAN